MTRADKLEAALRALMAALYVDEKGDLHGRDEWGARWAEAVAVLDADGERRE